MHPRSVLLLLWSFVLSGCAGGPGPRTGAPASAPTKGSAARTSPAPAPRAASAGRTRRLAEVRRWILALRRPDSRVEAALHLSATTPMPAEATPALLRALIGLRCPLCRGCHPTLIKVCVDARMHMVQAILNVGPAALAPLARAQRRPDPLGRLIAVEVIGHLGRQRPSAGTALALTFGLSDPDPRVRTLAANMLSLITPPRPGVVAHLARAAQDRRMAPRCMAVSALRSVGALEHRDGELRAAPNHAAAVTAAVVASARTCPRQVRSFRGMVQSLEAVE